MPNWVVRKTIIMKPIDSQVEEYLDYCKNVRRLTAQTMRSKVYILEEFAKLRLVDDMQDLTNKHLHAWVSMQTNGVVTGNKVTGRTINTRMSHMISFCKWLRDMDYKMQIKIALIEKVEEEPPRRNFFTREQIELVKKHSTMMERILVSMTFDSGLRASELQNLRLDNINGRHMQIIGKGRKQGDLYMTEETREQLDEWIELRDIADYLWPSPMHKDGRPYSVDQLRSIMRKAFLRVGLKGFYLHAMRHSFATDLQESGARIDETQKLLRHSSSKTTEIYLHGLDGKLDQIYDRLKNSKPATESALVI